MKRLAALAILLLLAAPVWAADYALIIGAGVDLTASGVVVNGGGTHACITVTGAGSSVGHATLANCKDDALNVGEDFVYSNSVTWCGADGDCTITVAAGKTLTGSNNAWRVAPTGAGTDSTTSPTVLAACPFRGCSGLWDIRPKKGSPLLNISSTSTDIGYYQHEIIIYPPMPEYGLDNPLEVFGYAN